MSVCLYVCMSVCLYVCMSLCLHVFMSVCLYVCMSLCLYFFMSICLYACMYVCLYVISSLYHNVIIIAKFSDVLLILFVFTFAIIILMYKIINMFYLSFKLNSKNIKNSILFQKWPTKKSLTFHPWCLLTTVLVKSSDSGRRHSTCKNKGSQME